MSHSTQIQVVEAVIDGQTVYLRSNSIFGPKPVTDPVHARNFALEDPHELLKFMSDLVIPGDEMFAKSGLRIDEPPRVVTFDVTSVFNSSRIGRMPHGS